MTVVAVAVVPVEIAAAEVQVESVEVAIAVKRRRPAETVANFVVDSRTVAVARSGKEDAVAVGAGDLVTVYAILGCPGPSAVIA